MHTDGQAGAERAHELATTHLYLIQHIVNQLSARYPRHIDRGELWNAGALGLVDASRRYDPASGVPFARYASIRIRGAMIDSTRSRDWTSRRVRHELREVNQAAEAFEATEGREPSADDLAERLGISVEELAERRAAAQKATLLHLDQPLYAEDGQSTSLGDTIADPDLDATPDAAFEQREIVGTLRTAIAFLPGDQRQVVERYYFQGALLRDIAESMGVTEARVSQIRAEALNAIRSYFATGYEGVLPVAENAPGRRQRAAFVAAMTAHTTWRTRLMAADAHSPASARAYEAAHAG